MRTVTSRLARAAATTLAVAAAWVLAAPALAGGPTSVLLVVPGGGGTASLYYDDPDYAELTRLVGTDTRPAVDGTGGGGHETESSVTVTWLIHDVQVWRVDRVYLGAPDGPWVLTQSAYEGDIWAAPATWHRPAQPKALLALLERLGLDVTGGGGAGALSGPVAAPEPSAPAREGAPASQRVEPASGGGVAWLLLAGAAVAGALVAGLVMLPLARRAGTRSAADLHDGPAGAAGSAPLDTDPVADDAGWSSPEELVTR